MLGDGGYGKRMRDSVLPAPWRGLRAASHHGGKNKCLAQSHKTRTRVVCEKEREVGWLAKQQPCHE